MENLQKKIGYKFKNIDLLSNALSHSSYAYERSINNNERIEFLGDSVLSICVAKYLFNSFNNLPEGDLTKLRSFLVCEDSLYEFAKKLDYGNSILLGRGEEHTGGRDRKSILADCFEAVLGAMYLDSDLETCERFIIPLVEEKLKTSKTFKDYKTALQEVIQQNPEERVEYFVVDQSGPDHNKVFTVEVRLNSNVIGTGKGKNKKQAEQNAACEALELMGL